MKVGAHSSKAVPGVQEAPARVCRRFAAAISLGNLHEATGCLTREACLITPDATAVHGREAVGEVIAQLIARRAQVDIRLSGILVAADVALAHETWLIQSETVGRETFIQPSSPTSVLRLVERRWKVAITAPWGLSNGSILAGTAERARGEVSQ